MPAREKESTNIRSAFCICNPGTDLLELATFLENKNIETLNYARPTRDHNHFQDTLSLLKSADLIICVIDDKDNESVCFWLGAAFSLNKPIVAISKMQNFPTVEPGIFFIRGELKDLSAFDIQLKAFIENIDFAETKRSVIPAKNRKINKRNIPDLEALSSLEKSLAEALAKSLEIRGISTQERLSSPGFIPDFSIWINNSSPAVGNPVILEVKSDSYDRSKAAEQIRSYAIAAEISTAILIVDDSHNEIRISAISLSPLVVIMSLKEFHKNLENSSLMQVLEYQRNLLAHSAS